MSSTAMELVELIRILVEDLVDELRESYADVDVRVLVVAR